jgi:hypothetical protein
MNYPPSTTMQDPYLLEHEERLLSALRRLDVGAQRALAGALGAPAEERARRIGRVFETIPGSSGAEWVIDVESDSALRLTILELLLRELRSREVDG